MSHPGPTFHRPTDSDGPPSPPTGPATPQPARRRNPAVAVAVVAALLAGGTGGIVGAQLGGSAAPFPLVSSSAAAGSLDGAAAAVLPSVVSVEVRGPGGSGTGSGFVIDADGHVLTNAHVVASGGAVQVVYADGRRVRAQVVGTDPATDVAVLQVPADGAPPALPLRDPGDLRVGEAVLAVGSPLGLTGTVTAGIISALDRSTGLGDERNRQTAIQTDAPINPGNSGGPLIDTAGRVVGMNTAIASLGSGNIGIGFAIPIDRAAGIARDLIDR